MYEADHKGLPSKFIAVHNFDPFSFWLLHYILAEKWAENPEIGEYHVPLKF